MNKQTTIPNLPAISETDALHWIQNQNGLIVIIGKNKDVTLTDGNTFEVEGAGILDAVIKLQDMLKTMQDAEENKTACG